MNPLNIILERLENVKQNGDSYRAACPAHEGESRSTLSIKQTDDGRVLLHDFGGCSALEVLNAVGLELADLYDRPVTVNMTPGQQRELREKVKMHRWKSARDDLIVEMNALLLIAGDVYRGATPDKADMDRMLLAGKRWRNALGEL